MRILLAIDSRLSYSEAPPSRLIYIAKSLKKEGFDVELIGREGEKITSVKTTTVTGGRSIARLKLLFLAYKKLLTQGYTHIIMRGASLAFFLMPPKIFFNKKIILDFHSWNFREIKLFYEKTFYNTLKIFLYYLTERPATKHSDLIMCFSQGLQTQLSEEERRKSIVLENGLDLAEIEEAVKEAREISRTLYEKYRISPKKPIAGFLGNWERQMDMEVMFEACRKADVSLIVIGKGPHIEKYKQEWKKVTFTGKLPKKEALKLISLCNVVIAPYKEAPANQPSYYSTRKVRDYLGLGKPILMADVRGRETFLVPYENVVFYRPGDPEELTNKIRMTISDEKLMERMRENNLKLARKFDWQFLVEKSGLTRKLLEL